MHQVSKAILVLACLRLICVPVHTWAQQPAGLNSSRWGVSEPPLLSESTPVPAPLPNDSAPATGRTSAAPSATSPESFPHVVLWTQENKPVQFYADLLQGKVVLINFFYTSCTSYCPRTTANLARLQDQFGEHFGRDVVMLSITVDPTVDTPPVLKKYAEAFKPKPGWYFLTGTKEDINQIRRKLGVYERNGDKTQHTGVLIYGNEALGTWTATHALLKPDFIASAVRRLITTQ